MKKIKGFWYLLIVKLFGDFFERLYTNKRVIEQHNKVVRQFNRKMHKQGLAIYDIDGIKVLARSRKNAERKAANIKTK